MAASSHLNWLNRYTPLVTKKTGPVNESGCRIWQGQLAVRGGVNYGIQKVAWLPGVLFNAPQKMYAHRIAYMCSNRTTDIPPGFDISHRCHNSVCVEASHLSCEPHTVNNNRIHCRNFGGCLGHGVYASCIFSGRKPGSQPVS